MDDLLTEFLTETAESLAVLDVELVKMEQNPNDPSILQNIFRLVHTIKGTCGFLGLPRLEAVAHAAENVLGKFRDGEIEVTPEAVTLILNSIDRIKEILGHIERTESEPEGNDQDLIVILNQTADTGSVPNGGNAAPSAAPEPEPAAAPEAPSWPVAAEFEAEFAAALAEKKGSAKPKAPEPQEPPETETPAASAPSVPATAQSKAVEKPAEPKTPAKPPAADQGAGANAGGGEHKESNLASQSIRVNVELLENLMTLVSELVLTRNQLLQLVRGRDDSEFATPLQRLSHITTDLQESVMKTRMQPIGNAWAKLPRIVRDLSIDLNKKIDLQMIGAETELDRQVLELIKDPLTHMVRNSADHGLEGPEERKAAGKSEVGRVTLNAYHEGGHIIIEISDDGRGLNLDKIRAKALSNGLITEVEMDSLTDQQVAQMIFKAGLSTAEKVTSVSGRGVGMDVVKTNIERIGGTIELKTQQGKGSTFVIKIPLTLAIVSALIVECSGERFAIPQISVLELVRVSANSENGIEVINDAPVLRLRDRLLPLVSLRNLLRLDDEKDEKSETFVVVAQVGTYTFGIMVDRVFDTEEIVVKPVAPILRNITMFSGNTILGDGSVIMILDPNGIASATGEAAMAGAAQQIESAAQRVDLGRDDRTTLLVFRSGGRDLKAVPLALVARLEEIDLASVEYSHGKPVVQYRGHLMPLIPIDPTMELGVEGRQPVLVFSDRERTMGLLVDEIVDIVDESLKVELAVDQPGLIGTAVIAGKATDMIDAGYYLTQAFGDWFGSQEDLMADAEDGGGRRVLLVDDSPFFRNLLGPVLAVAGYEVTAVETAERALALRDAGRSFDIIISDIEMSGMSGFEFAEAVRADGPWQATPMVALSSHASDKDLERGRQVGFNDYVQKFDRDALLVTLSQTLADAEGVA